MDAIARIKQLGMPRRNDELWTFFPVAKIPAPEFPDACASEEDFSGETDFAALLPVAQNARTMVQNIADGSEEMALLKCNNDFGRTILNVGKGAKASFEILDNKVAHSVSAERFDINVGEGADVEIFFANPANDLPLTFRHFRITQAAGSQVRFSAIERGNGISRVSIDDFLQGPGAHFEVRTLNMLGGTAESHHRLHIYHESPETTSTQLSRNLLDGSSRASYDGSVIVGANCTKANSGQLVNTILLSEDSSVSAQDLPRRRGMHARQHGRRTRCRADVLPRKPRHPERDREKDAHGKLRERNVLPASRHPRQKAPAADARERLKTV